MTITSSIRALLAPLLLLTLALVAPGCGGGGIAGTWEAKAPEGEEGTMTLELASDQSAKLSASGGQGFGMSFTGTWSSAGDQVTITPPGGKQDDTVVLTKKGSTLEGHLLGEDVSFQKR
jgi:hypothetical protein